MRRVHGFGAVLLASALCAAVAGAAPRDVQFASVDFETSVIELHNFGVDTESLSGWQFCSHDDNESFRYSSPGSLNGVSIAAGESLFVHFLNDAGVTPGHMNLPGGPFALPLDRGPYGIQIYFAPVSFFNGSTIADHIQWSVGGVDNTTIRPANAGLFHVFSSNT